MRERIHLFDLPYHSSRLALQRALPSIPCVYCKAGDSGSNPESASPDIPNYPTGVSPVYHPHTSYHS